MFTGYLGSGKTTIILGLIRSLPADYKCVWLKNEFGDMEIDSEMAKENNIAVRALLLCVDPYVCQLTSLATLTTACVPSCLLGFAPVDTLRLLT